MAAVAAPGAGAFPLPPPGIKAVIWDWDRTVLAIHSWGQRRQAAAVTAGQHDGDYADQECFAGLVRQLQGAGVRVFIASFGSYDVIRAYTDRLFGGESPFTRETISTPSVLGEYQTTTGGKQKYLDGTKVQGQKLPQLKKICDAAGLKPEEVMFFDDDLKNIAGELGALSMGYHYSFYCPEAFNRHVWAEALRRIAAGDPTGMGAAAKAGTVPGGVVEEVAAMSPAEPAPPGTQAPGASAAATYTQW